MTDYGDGVFMQGEGSALLRRVSLALSIFWGMGLVSMVCTSAILQNSSLHPHIDSQVCQQAVDSLHGRTSIPLSMLAYSVFGTVTGVVGYRAGKHDGQNTPALVLGIVSVIVHALLSIGRLPQLNVGGLILLVLSVLYVSSSMCMGLFRRASTAQIPLAQLSHLTRTIVACCAGCQSP